jgi:DNA-binding NarL/FixJ family response regulator
MKKILIIDDNRMHRLIDRRYIEASCPGLFEVIETDNAATGFEMIVNERPACVLLDFMMVGEDGFQALHKMKSDIPDCPPIIFITSALTEDLKRNALALGAVACFEKSMISGPELAEAIIKAVGRDCG